jgi:hypothetical protein
MTTVETTSESHTTETAKTPRRHTGHGIFAIGVLGAGLALGSLTYIDHHHTASETAVTSVTFGDEVITYIDKSEVIAAAIASIGFATATIAAGVIATEVSKEQR